MLTPFIVKLALGGLSGVLVGFSLGLVGGGGSVLAVPLLVYLVGVPEPHIAIGSSAVAVAANAVASLAHHARAGTIKWRCASVFAIFGVTGALGGSTVGKLMNGEKLLALFGVLMLVVAGLMFRNRGGEGYPHVRLNRENFPRLAATGLTTGALSGFFGIGGGFLIAPGLMASTGMTLANAGASSLVSVTLFGTATSLSYAASGQLIWPLFGALVVGGAFGTLAALPLARHLASRANLARRIFAVLVIAVAIYILVR